MRIHTMIPILLFTTSLSAQVLQEHLWKDRVLIILHSNMESELADRQMALLEACPKSALAERRLKVYRAKPIMCNTSVTDEEVLKSVQLFTSYKQEATELEVLLIGLDGGIKMRKEGLVQPEEIFARIDGMPMRKAELRKSARKKSN